MLSPCKIFTEVEDFAIMVSGADAWTDDGDPEMPPNVPDKKSQPLKLKEELKEFLTTDTEKVKNKESIFSKTLPNKLSSELLYPDLELALHFVSPYHVTIEGKSFIRSFASNYKTNLFETQLIALCKIDITAFYHSAQPPKVFSVEINNAGVLCTTSDTLNPSIPAQPFTQDERIRGYQITAAFYTSKNAQKSGTFYLLVYQL